MLTETITWHAVTDSLPDADSTVLVAIDTTTPHTEPVWLGYLDGDTWRDIAGDPITVTHWAEMLRGPAGVPAATAPSTMGADQVWGARRLSDRKPAHGVDSVDGRKTNG